MIFRYMLILIKALEIAPEQIHFKFNVAFVQIQLAQAIHSMSETSRTLRDITAASAGLDEAIVSLEEIAQQPNTPYPKALIEGRANMARNTMKRQLERTATAQKEYEERESEKIRINQELHQKHKAEEERKKREEEERIAEKARKIAEERRKIAEHDRMLAEQRARERMEQEEAEMTVDSETGERVKRKPRSKRKGGRKKGDESGDESGEEQKDKKKRRTRKKTASGSEDEGESKPISKRRRLEKKGGKKVKEEIGKFKSAEVVVDSDEEAEEGDAKGRGGDEDGYGSDAGKRSSPVSSPPVSDDDEEERAPVQRTARRRLVESEDEDEDMEDAGEADKATPVQGDAEDDVVMAKDEGGGGMTEGAEGGNVNDDRSLANGTADVEAPPADANGFKVGEIDAASPGRDREPDAEAGDEPMGDADRMHDGLDDAEEDEGEVYK